VLSPDDLPTLAVFAEVVERRSFTAAAAAVGLAKSAISRRIAALETRMGVRLLQRTTRLVSPTEEGGVRSLIDFLVGRFRDRAWQRRSLLAPAR
jgi:hypothetical protein